MIMPGEDSAVRLQLVKQMVIEPNQQFTIRAGTSTIGTGKVSCKLQFFNIQHE